MKKKRGQDDNSLDGSEESSESGNRSNFSFALTPCTHFTKAVDKNNIQKVISRSKEPPNYCYDCKKSNEEDSNITEDEPLETPPLWICLKCMHVACGRTQKSHAEKHHDTPRSDIHCVVIDTSQWSIWCYKCDEFIVDEMLSPQNVKALEIIRNQFKKWSSPTNSLNKPKIDIPITQNKTLSVDNEKKKIVADLPKVGGLSNLGNTCFFNSVLQCLAQTPYIIQVLDDLQVPGQKFMLSGGRHKGTDDEEIEFPPIHGNLESTDISITSVLRETLSNMQNSNGNVFRPADLYYTLRRKTINCTDGGQHDSHELLRHLLDLVRSEDARRYQEVILEDVGLNKKTKPDAVDGNLKARVKFYGNQLTAKFLGPERVFRGELISTINCQECENTSHRKEPFLDLSLPVCVDKSFTSVLKRKSTGSENSIDALGNVSHTLSKHELKKAHKAHRKNKRDRQRNRENGNLNSLNVNLISEEKKGNAAESEESDADVEDNVENEDSSTKIKELSTHPALNADLNVSPEKNNKLSSLNNSGFEFSGQPNEDNINCNLSPSSTDVQMKDLTETKQNITEELSTDLSSSEKQTFGPSNSPLTSKNPASPTTNEDDEETTEKINKSDFSEKRDSSEKEELLSKNSNFSNKNPKKRYCTEKNGVVDVVLSDLSKLNVTSSYEFPRSYPTAEGESSVQQCLNQFTATELMNGNNKVGCTRCTEKMNKGKKGKMVCTDSTKQYLISKAPAVLILHLKRFQAQRFGFHKVNKHVDFPIILDLAPVSKEYTQPRIYALYGVVEHSGTMYGGHYIAYVKSRAPLKPNDPRWAFLPSKDGFENKDFSSESSSSESNSELDSDDTSSRSETSPPIEPPPGQWYYASDSRVHEVDERTVLNSEAYLLFYERIF